MKKISFETLKDLAKRDEGLSEAEVSRQRSRYGSNEIVEVAGNPWLELVLDTFKDPMIWFLVGIGTVLILVGDSSEAIILFIAIIPLVFMDAVLHWRTQASTSGLRGQLASQVTVVRAGREVQIDSHELVPGDLIPVMPGLRLPADGIFQDLTDLQVDESVLTGEAFPIQKHVSQVDPFLLCDKGEISVDPDTLGYAGTRILTGAGRMRVLWTGQRTAYGEIVQSVANMPHERTPLQRSITSLVQGLIFAAGILCLLLAGVRIYQGHGWLDALLSAATLAVAAIPEEFPVVFTFFLGVGVYRLAKRRALVRRAVSVENIGRVTHICTDKTGTITIGALQLTHMDPCEGLLESDVLGAALAACNADGSDPVDLAILDRAARSKLTPPLRLRIFPFTEDRKRETAFIREPGGRIIAYMKGAPETVLAHSSLSDESRLAWEERTAKWAREGHKILACARKILTQDQANQKTEPQTGFEFVGLLAFEDPPRAEVAAAINYCQRNGIGVLMITGDHPETAVAIAREVGLGGESPVVASAEVEPGKFEQEWLDKNPEFLIGLNVVARCSPLQKLRIVNALKRSGELVAVTGDGVNDVPALKAADIGIAMGQRGTQSAKEVSSIVLADDNFRTIVGAIREGRQLFTNLRTSFRYLLLIHIPFVLTAAVIPLLGYPLLYLPVHIVWLELIIHPSALFAFQQSADGIDEKFRSQKSFLSRKDISVIVVIGAALTVALGFAFIASLGESLDIGHARAVAMAILTFWSAGLVIYLASLRTWAAVGVAAGTLLSAVVLIQMPSLAKILHMSPIHLMDWILSMGVVFGGLLLLFLSQFALSSRQNVPAKASPRH